MPIANILDSFVSSAQSHRYLPAIEQEHAHICYSELLDRAIRIKEKLIAIGLEPKDVVGICGAPNFGLYASILGVLLANGIILLIDPQLPPERIRFMVEESSCRLLLVAGRIQAELPNCQKLKVDAASASILSLTGNIVLLRGWPSMCREYDSPAYIFCTSGTTAQPRLVVGRHEALAHFIDWQRRTFQVGAGDRVAQLTGLSFDVVLRDIFLPLTSGATLCIPNTAGPLAPSAVLPWLKANCITRLHAVPTVAQSWLALDSERTSLDCMRTVFFAGEPLTDVLVARWRQRLPAECEIVNLYGPTETTLAKFFYRVPKTGVKEGIQPVGAPLPGCELYILDKDLQECAPGIAGQVAIDTEYCSYGYLRQPEESAHRFRLKRLTNGTERTLFLTGDLGKISSSGELHILGRIDHQVKINGMRVELEEISAIAVKHPGVASGVTVAFDSTVPGAKLLCLYWTPDQSHQPPNTQALRQFLSRYLPQGTVPSLFVRLEFLPVTPNGKVDRSSLPLPRLFASDFVPKTDAEKQLLPVWKSVLELTGGVPGADFFGSGGTSLSVVELQLQVEERLGVNISAADIFDQPRFESVARLIADAQGDREAGKMRIPRAPDQEEYPVLPAQRAYLTFHFGDGDHTWSSVSTVFQFDCAVSSNAMKQALSWLTERHQNLQLTFHSREGMWVQTLNKPGMIPLEELDLRPMKPPDQQLALLQAQKKHLKTVLRPDRWPLYMAMLAQISERDTRLILTSSHLISDALSHEIIAQELNEYIRCLQQRAAISLPRLDVQFLDYVMWKLEQRRVNPGEESLCYWQKVFAGCHERLQLPIDGDPAAGASAAGYKRWFPGVLSDQVRSLSRKLNCSPFVVLFSAFAITLHALSGKRTIILKTVADGRPYPFLRKWIGNFATVVHVRSEARESTTFLEYVKAIQKSLAEAVKHQECEFIEVLESLDIPMETDRIPLASIFLNPVGPGSERPSSGDEEYRDELGHEEKADIMAYVRQTEPLIEIDIHYRKGLYSRETIRRLVGVFERTLGGMISAPESFVATVREAVA